MRRSIRRRTGVVLVLVLALVLAGAGCGDDDGGGGGSGGGEATTLRLGIFPNVTHAPGHVGLELGLIEDALGDEVDLQVFSFNAGGEAITALFSGSLDITYIGPNPAINAFAQSDGEAVRLIAGSTSGGAFLVVRPGIDTPADLAGTKLASPALGNTQDVAMRAWLADQGYEVGTAGGGDVEVVPLENPDILQAFQLGELDGAWVPEPWAFRLVDEAGAQVLVDERDLWPDGRYVTTHVLAATDFLAANPGVVRRFLAGHLDAVEATNADAGAAQAALIDGIEGITGTRLPEEVIAGAWPNLLFTWDPIASSLAKSATDATDAGLLDPVDLDGIYDLTILNELLEERGEPSVAGL